MRDVSLWSAGQPIEHADDLVRRYCGLPWSGGDPEIWAYRYFDLVPTKAPSLIDPSDVTSCAALHGGLRHEDLDYFGRSSHVVEQWLGELPSDVDLAHAEADVVDHVMSLPTLAGPVGMALLSKVAHRKRPRLVPMWDRAVADRYKRLTLGPPEGAWRSFVSAFRDDLRHNREPLDGLIDLIRTELPDRGAPSSLRVLDIAAWMSAR